MATLTEIREGLAANLAAISGLHQSAYILSNPTLPAAEIEPSEIVYDEAMARGLDELTFTVRVFVADNLDVSSQKRLDRMLAPSGADSVKAAIETDRTLGGKVDDLRVTRCSGYRRIQRSAATSVGAEWTVQVLA